jgi:UDP-3-O-[3-hydroxymyristoyl] glucosamine N-acyltransferase
MEAGKYWISVRHCVRKGYKWKAHYYNAEPRRATTYVASSPTEQGSVAMPYTSHPNGGGLVHETAFVEMSAWISPTARVMPYAHVGMYAYIGIDVIVDANQFVCDDECVVWDTNEVN